MSPAPPYTPPAHFPPSDAVRRHLHLGGGRREGEERRIEDGEEEEEASRSVRVMLISIMDDAIFNARACPHSQPPTTGIYGTIRVSADAFSPFDDGLIAWERGGRVS